MVTRQSYTQLGLIPPSLEDMPTGKEFYVHNGTGSDGNPGTKAAPFKTLDFAIGQCTSSSTSYPKADTIYLLPFHAENISAAGTVTCDVIGVNIVGLGRGNARPTFSWSATAGTWLITAANVTVRNIICKASIDSVVNGFNISAAGATLDKVDFQETASAQMLIFVQTTAGANNMTISNCSHVQAAAGSAKWIDLVGADWAHIYNNFLMVNASTHVIGGTTTASLEVDIHGNRIVNPADAAGIVLLASSTGMVHDNFGGGAKSAQAAFFALASAYGGLNYVTNAANKNGTIDPAADT